MQRSLAVRLLDIDICAITQQRLHDLVVAVNRTRSGIRIRICILLGTAFADLHCLRVTIFDYLVKRLLTVSIRCIQVRMMGQ